MNKLKKVGSFVFFFILTFLAIEGLEHRLHEMFGICIHSALSFGGAGVIVLWGIKLHIFCCVLPAAVSAFLCARKKHKHCEHEHKNGGE